MLGIIKSFNPRAYRGFARQRVTRTIGFFIVVTLLISVVMTYQSYSFINQVVPELGRWVENNFDTIFSDIPTIEIENGKILSPGEFYMKKLNNKFVFIIEPEVEQVYPILERYENVVVLAQKRLLMKFTRNQALEESQMKTYNLGKLSYFKLEQTSEGIQVSIPDHILLLTEENVKNTIEKVASSIYPLLFIFFFFYYNGAKLIQVFLFSLFSLVLNNLMHAGCSYSELFNIGVYALVPPTVLALACSFIPVHIPFFALIYIMAYGVFLGLALKAMKG
ncbi:MAG: DUF1189 family protein [Candidatus Omnitrophica bacterium]|nr:DUF1189 family protein [Candidatus Omnitrophota bacterium]